VSIFSDVERTIEREFRRWTEKVFGSGDSDQLLLVHRAILEDVAGKIQMARRGRRVFPFNYLLIRLVSPDPARRALFQSAFGEKRRLESDIREILIGAGCDVPAGFAADVETGETGSQKFDIDYMVRENPAPTSAKSGPARITVVRGKANQESFLLDKPRTTIGRLAELIDSRQRVVRRNDVAFEEDADEANRTVSRGHAHIRFDAEAAEYRICDDSSEYGTRIFRDGRSIEVPSGGKRGERLRTGDEIYLGRACLRFEW
jgi:hypothetical protein